MELGCRLRSRCRVHIGRGVGLWPHQNQAWSDETGNFRAIRPSATMQWIRNRARTASRSLAGQKDPVLPVTTRGCAVKCAVARTAGPRQGRWGGGCNSVGHEQRTKASAHRHALVLGCSSCREHRYTPITPTNSLTAAALLSSPAFSSAVSLISIICSIPLAPSFTGTPT
jgi:hypothetical protein